jgi:hypothetical protein
VSGTRLRASYMACQFNLSRPSFSKIPGSRGQPALFPTSSIPVTRLMMSGEMERWANTQDRYPSGKCPGKQAQALRLANWQLERGPDMQVTYADAATQCRSTHTRISRRLRTSRVARPPPVSSTARHGVNFLGHLPGQRSFEYLRGSLLLWPSLLQTADNVGA